MYAAGFISGFRSRGGKHIEANFKGGGGKYKSKGGNPILDIWKANFQGGANQSQGGGGESTPWPPPEINPVCSIIICTCICI
jgi:hypothetical protein